MSTISPPWAPQLILDIALESHSPDELYIKYSIDKPTLDHYYTIPQFTREIINARAELTSSGSTFRAHARVIAEVHLETMHDILNDQDAPASLKHEIWKTLVEYAKLKPPKEADPSQGGGAITINIAGYAQAPPRQPAPMIDIIPEARCLP